MAHKLARLVYRMLMWGHAYVDKGLQYYEERHREQPVHVLKNEPQSSVYKSSNPKLLDLFREGFWRD
jgi:hypothetical protein